MTKTHGRPVSLKEFKKGFSVLDKRISGVERRLAGVDQRLAGVDQRLAGVDQRLDGVDQRLDDVEGRLGSVEKRLESKIEAQGKSLRAEIHLVAERTEERVDEKARQYRDQILTAFDQFLVEIKTAREERPVMAAQIANHEDRLEKLESKVFTSPAS